VESARKLESVGRLAGGVAHDLNNLLAPIIGYSELLMADFEPDDPRAESVEEIQKAGERAKELVQQLLAFGRKQALEFRRIEVNPIIENFRGLLRRAIRENIEMRIEPGPELPATLGDVGQIEQVIMNLVINAQEAMPEGGVLTIETGSAENATAQQHVYLAITDTGPGIDADTREHLFEPFFTTKRDSGGTGLGLATVYGIVQQHGGFIEVKSNPGAGARFEVYLPVAESAGLPSSHAGATAGRLPVAAGRREIILLVEDNAQVRSLAAAILARKGYTVLEAADGSEAMRIIDQQHGAIDLLITDVIMPKIDGKKLHQMVVARHHGIKALFMSGYTDDVIARHGILEDGVTLIQKPFAVEEFARTVREVLDR
jgi:two-component system, cell cycle sensor histidine kinase and response regulator CckA